MDEHLAALNGREGGEKGRQTGLILNDGTTNLDDDEPFLAVRGAVGSNGIFHSFVSHCFLHNLYLL